MLLGFAPGAAAPTVKQLRRAYHAAALKQHPDKGGSHEAFLEVQHAYEALKEHARATD